MTKMQHLFISATGTDCGKTIVTKLLLHQLKHKSFKLTASKMVMSGVAKENSELFGDIWSLAQVVGFDHVVNWRCYPDPLSPHLAAEYFGDKWELSDLIQEYNIWLSRSEQQGYDWAVSEAAGGVMTPLTWSHTWLDLLPHISVSYHWLVTHSALGSISQTLTALQAARSLGVKIDAVIIVATCKHDELLQENSARSIRSLGKIACYNVPYITDIDRKIIDNTLFDLPPLSSWLLGFKAS
jgi:dethiobiotin synthetase